MIAVLAALAVLGSLAAVLAAVLCAAPGLFSFFLILIHQSCYI